jgi:site-specific DNA-cytosine methylase
MIKLLIGGSPCTKWSIAQKKDREVTASGEGWELFLNYKIAKDKFKPDFFLYENNKSAAQAIKDQISMELGVPLMHINSALVSAQNRQRFYAFNWTVPQPEDRGIFLKDILESGRVDKDKAYCLKHQAGNSRDYFKKHHTQVAFEPVGVGYRNRRNDDGRLSRRFETDGDAKANALTTVATDSMVAEPIRVGGLPRPNGEISTSQAMRIYSVEGKSTTLSANGGGMGGKTGLYAIPVNETVRVGDMPNAEGVVRGGQAHRIYDASGKAVTLTARPNGGGVDGPLYASSADGKQSGTVYEVKDGLIEIKGQKYKIKLPDGFYIIRKLSVTECCRLQTLPDDYCRAVSASRAYTGLGGGWTAEVIIHILQGALKDVPKDEEIVVLSMYDGIGTGRYCLEQMGFTNIKYYAYEIDPYAIKISASNYPDIIQLGNAFDLRNEDWHLPEQEETMYKCDACKHNTNDYVCKLECGGCDGESHFEEKSQKYISMNEERAAEILDPTHREQYEDIEEVNEACRIGRNALLHKTRTPNTLVFAKARLAEELHESELGADNGNDIRYWTAYIDGAKAQAEEDNYTEEAVK